MISYLNHRLFRGILFNFWLFGPYHDIYCYFFQFKYMLGFFSSWNLLRHNLWPSRKMYPSPPTFSNLPLTLSSEIRSVVSYSLWPHGLSGSFFHGILWARILAAATTAAKSLQSCPTLCDPIDGSPPGYPIPGILQARTLEWVAISSSNAWKWKVKVKSLSRVRLLATPWTAAYQAPASMGFSRQEYRSGVPSRQGTVIPQPYWPADRAESCSLRMLSGKGSRSQLKEV